MGATSLIDNLLRDTTDSSNFTKKKYDYLCRLGPRKTSLALHLLANSDGGVLWESHLYEYILGANMLIIKHAGFQEEDNPNLPTIQYNEEYMGAYLFPPEKLLSWLEESRKLAQSYSFWSLNLAKITETEGRIAKTQHATLVIFDHWERTVYLMDPNGIRCRYTEAVDGLLGEYFQVSGYQYIPALAWGSTTSLQTQYRGKFDSGTCASWCLLFVAWMLSKDLKPYETYREIAAIEPIERGFLIYRFNNNLYHLIRGTHDDSDLKDRDDDEEGDKKN